MLTFTYKVGLFNVTERVGKAGSSHFMEPETHVSLDMRLFTTEDDVAEFVKPKNSVCLLMPNYIIDLRQTEEQIFKNISRSTRRNIRKAMNQDHFNFIELENPTNEQIIKFSELYDEFAREINIKKCNVRKLKAIRDKGALVISYITNQNNQVLCAHAYLMNTRQAYGIYSVLSHKKGDPIDGQTIGRANKYLDWRNIQSAKSKGCSWYNFGGKIFEEVDEKGKNVNQYKKSFGSISGYDLRVYKANGTVGKLFLLLLHFYYKWRRRYEYAFTFETLSISHQNRRIS
ncbi:aminoacyltransferase [Siminovitchia fortis]|uniref:aminoacyltransferase n=1 Tax=Siminovitchia fortis TaxID=254758 RepID=UPI0011A72C47|nr:aminoacyltransferase [Siminovitchia fortis]